MSATSFTQVIVQPHHTLHNGVQHVWWTCRVVWCEVDLVDVERWNEHLSTKADVPTVEMICDRKVPNLPQPGDYSMQHSMQHSMRWILALVSWSRILCLATHAPESIAVSSQGKWVLHGALCSALGRAPCCTPPTGRRFGAATHHTDEH